MKFEITYHLEGTRKVEIVVPDSVELPDVWSDFTNEQKDAWIFSNQSEAKDIFEDIHHATAMSVEWAD